MFSYTVTRGSFDISDHSLKARRNKIKPVNQLSRILIDISHKSTEPRWCNCSKTISQAFVAWVNGIYCNLYRLSNKVCEWPMCELSQSVSFIHNLTEICCFLPAHSGEEDVLMGVHDEVSLTLNDVTLAPWVSLITGIPIVYSTAR